MKIRDRIVEDVKSTDKSVIVQLDGDKEKQHFELHCLFSPYYKEMSKWDSWDFVIKLQSEVFTEPKTGKKSYFTHLICKKADNRLRLGEIPEQYK